MALHVPCLRMQVNSSIAPSHLTQYADDPEEFLNQPSPQNRQKYIEAITEVMKQEYEAIADAGIVLQLDCPDLGASRWTFVANLSDEEFLKIAEFHIEALNQWLYGKSSGRSAMARSWRPAGSRSEGPPCGTGYGANDGT
jgi:hypothetical protein